MEYEILKGLFGKIVYVEYFREYILHYGNKVYYFPKKDKYQDCGEWEKEKFPTLQDCEEFCRERGIKVVISQVIPDPLRNGLPDCRSIKPIYY